MHICVRLDENWVRRWHISLLERLDALPGITLSVRIGSGMDMPPSAVEAMFQLEATLHRLNGLGSIARVPLSALAAFRHGDGGQGTGTQPDLLLDLTGEETTADITVWRVSYNGLAGEAGLIALIMDGQTPVAEITEGGRIIATGRLGTEYGGIVLSSYQDMAARTTTLIISSISGGGPVHLPGLPGKPYHSGTANAPPMQLSTGRLAVLASKMLAGRVIRHIYKLCYNAPHWQIGWRASGDHDLFDLRAHPSGGWNVMQDDGKRFYADPFPILANGKVTLFVEEYAHATAKGVISAVEFNTSGPVGRPVPVLELDCHLSYPFVFEREGQFWMIPESCQNGTVELFRATAFPGGWVKEATLLSGITASDATIVEHGGRWWMLATVRDGGGAFSDALHLWSAPDFRGPWSAHQNNPVMIDIASARPAGRMVQRAGSLLRPVQDCRRGYGAALGIARVTQLDDTGFEQTVETLLGPGHSWPGRRMHTLNAAGGLEFIDGSGHAPRWKSALRMNRDQPAPSPLPATITAAREIGNDPT